MLLASRLKKIDKDFKILRYRDDYRIFTNNPQVGEEILKNLSEVLTELGLKLNPQKTNFSQNVIQNSIKADKYHTIVEGKIFTTMFNELIYIHSISEKFPNS